MAAITFAVELDSKIKKNGLSEIRIRLTQNRKLKRFNIGYAIEAKHWNKEKGQVRNSHPLHIIINAAISSKLVAFQKQYLQNISQEKVITSQQIISKAKSEILGADFISYFKDYLEGIKNGNSYYSYKSTFNKLKRYQSCVYFSEIDFAFLEKYDEYLRSKLGNAGGTVLIDFAVLRSVYNTAVKKRVFVPTGVSPFSIYTVKRDKIKRNKLTLEEIEAIEKMDIPEGTKIFDARNIFLLCYYFMGMRMSSMIRLKWSAIKGNRCYYEAAKGGKQMDVMIMSKAQVILDYYKKNNQGNSEYIFPYLGDTEDKEGIELRDKIRVMIKEINKKLKHIEIQLGTGKQITSHIARHSFAYNARIISGNDIYAVQKALGHASIATTERYFATDSTIEADDLVRKMFN